MGAQHDGFRHNTEEHLRLRRDGAAWRSWGPYLSERAWGTVREDYSAAGEAWDFFPHDHARSRVYHWNGAPSRRARRSPCACG